MSGSPLRVGVLSDTHGHLDGEILDTLAGSDLILHAGDVGGEAVLATLRRRGPVVAVAGNGDPSLYAHYPWDQRVELGPVRILLCHWYDNFGRVHPKIVRELAAWRPHVLIYGHTHVAVNEKRDDVLHVNPGYAGPPGGGRARSVARLEVEGEQVRAEIVPLASD